MQKINSCCVNNVVITCRLYSITASTWSQINQHQQMPTATSRTSCERQAENPRFHVAYYVRCPSASATLVLSLLCHGRGGESHLTHLQYRRWCLSAGAVVQLVSVTSVWPALLLMRAAVSHRCSLLKSDAYMCKCGHPLSLKLPLPLVRFCPHLSWPCLSPPCGRPLWMTPYIDVLFLSTATMAAFLNATMNFSSYGNIHCYLLSVLLGIVYTH